MTKLGQPKQEGEHVGGKRKPKYQISTALTSLPFKPKLIHMKDPPASGAAQLGLIVQSPGPYSIGAKGQTGVYKGGN